MNFLKFFAFLIIIFFISFSLYLHRPASTNTEPTILFVEKSQILGLNHTHSSTLPIIDRAKANSLESLHALAPDLQLFMIGGIAVADINNDHYPDIFLAGGADANQNKLFLNRKGSFEDYTDNSSLSFDPKHITNGASFADLDNNGIPDLFVGTVRTNKSDPDMPTGFYLWKGNNDYTYTDHSSDSNLQFHTNIFSTTFSDLNADNYLDFLSTHWQRVNTSGKNSHIWINNHKGAFIAEAATPKQRLNYDIPHDWSFTPGLSDLDNDGYKDLVIVGDFETTMVFKNSNNEKFVNITSPDVITDENGMGLAFGDYNNDGLIDWFVSSIFDPLNPHINAQYSWSGSGNRLYKNTGDGQFEDASIDAGISDGGWGWAACMKDFNLDGHLDIFHVTGYLMYVDDPSSKFFKLGGRFYNDLPRLFLNDGDGSFYDFTEEAGFRHSEGRSISCTDFDRDGDIDIVIQQLNKETLYYENQASNKNNPNNFIGINIGSDAKSLKARIKLVTKEFSQIREINLGSNYLSQNAAEALFGIGTQEEADLYIYWQGASDRSPQIIKNIAINQWHYIQKE